MCKSTNPGATASPETFNRSTELAAEQICKWFGYDRVFFGHSGSDAIDTSIYIAKYYTGKTDILAYSVGYHGTNTQASVYDSYTALLDAVNSNTAAVIIEPIMITNGVIEFDKQTLQQQPIPIESHFL